MDDYFNKYLNQGYSLIEVLISIALGLVLLSLLIKLYGMVDGLNSDVRVASQLNRNAVLVRLILTHEIQNAKNEVVVLDNGHRIKIDQKVFYCINNNLYTQKNQDNAVELLAGIKNFNINQAGDTLEFNLVVYPKERFYESRRVYFNNRINLHFFVKLNHIIQS